MEELLRDLRITAEPIEAENGTYVIDIPNSNEYARYFSKLSKATDIIEEDTEASQTTIDTVSIQFYNTDYILTLVADMEEDVYKLTIREK